MSEGFNHEKNLIDSKTEWFTPKWILDELGIFDLDPCSSDFRPFDIAKKHFTIKDDGIKQKWKGRVFANPPYGREMIPFMEKMAKHGSGIALCFARTETKCYHEWIWPYAHSFLFLKGRVCFLNRQGESVGTSGSPSILIAYSDYDGDVLANFAGWGKFLMNEKVKGV